MSDFHGNILTRNIMQSSGGGGGSVTDVTATSPLSSSGGNTPDISLSGTVAINHGGTGATTAPTALANLGGVGSVGASTDNAVTRFNGTSGLSIQNSGVILDDSNNITGVNQLTVNENLFAGNDTDATFTTTLAYNQFGQIITDPFNPGDSYVENMNISAVVNLSTDYPSLAIDGLDVDAVTDPTSTTSFSQLIGINNVTDHLGSGDIGNITAGSYSAHNTGSGNVTDLKAGNFVIANLHAGTVTNGFGVYIESPVQDASNGNFTNLYGIYIESQNVGTNKWQIYSAGVAPSFFAGEMQLKGGESVNRIATAVSYSILSSDYYIGVTSTAAARTITLPSAAIVGNGKVYVVKDESGVCTVNNITIATTGGQTIDGQTSIVLNINYGSLNVISNGSNWFIY